MRYLTADDVATIPRNGQRTPGPNTVDDRGRGGKAEVHAEELEG
jgi:hypothetical protein